MCRTLKESDGGIVEYGFDYRDEIWRDPGESGVEGAWEDCGKLKGDAILLHLWNRIVCAYSDKLLAVPGDKLLAISAVAKVVGEGMSGKILEGNAYVAGLWEQNFPSTCSGLSRSSDQSLGQDTERRPGRGHRSRAKSASGHLSSRQLRAVCQRASWTMKSDCRAW